MRLIFQACLLFFLVLGGQTSADAETRALLIGVSDYDESIGLTDLRGPPNDVRLMRKTLRDLGVNNITVLADNVANARRPTRAAIKAAFMQIAASVGKGDTVVIQFSGHGTRQKDTSGDEADGIDEVFLPSDTLPADAGVGLIKNAILDDEFGSWTANIRRTGADVWLIIDTCHSGTGLRNTSDLLAPRYVDPAILGAPLDTPGQGTVRAPKRASPQRGGIVAFYAAQSDEIAQEMNFGSIRDGSKSAGPWYGLFTARLAHRLRSLQSLSYRQLFQSVLADLNRMALPNQARRQTPSWEGTMGERIVLGAVRHKGALSYSVVGGELNAGQVHNLTVGTIVNLFSRVNATAEQAIGRAQLTEVFARRARLQSVARSCITASTAPLCQANGTLPPGTRFARVAARAPTSRIGFSSVRYLPGRNGKVAGDGANLVEALQAAVDRLNRSGRTNIKLGATKPDVQVGLRDGKLWFGGTVDIDGLPAGVSWSSKTGPLAPLLVRIYTAEVLAKRLRRIRKQETVLDSNPIQLNGRLRRSNPRLLRAPGQVGDPIAECQAILQASNGYQPPVALTARAPIKQCDQLNFSAQGRLSGSRDVNRVYIDAKYCVTSQYNRVQGDAVAVAVGEGMISCSDCPDGYSAGLERVFIVASDVIGNSAPFNLDGVLDTCSSTMSTRSAAVSVPDVLRLVRQSRATRSSLMEAASPMVWVRDFSWIVAPRAVALADVAGELPARSVTPWTTDRK